MYIMNRILLSASALLLFSAAVSAQEAAHTYNVKVGDFTELKVDDNINVVYSNNPDSVGMARFVTAKNPDAVMFNNNKKGTLTIRVATDDVNKPYLPTVFVYSDFLQSVKNSADSTVRIVAMKPVPEFKLQTSANGKIIAKTVEATTVRAQLNTGKGVIILGGKCSEGQLKLIGTGEIQADQLVCTNISCRMLGTGTIGCNVSGVLSIKGSGTGKVYYKGKPSDIKTSTLGPVKAIQMDE